MASWWKKNASIKGETKLLEFVCKTDMEKEYGHVDWTFLYFMFARMAFG